MRKMLLAGVLIGTASLAFAQTAAKDPFPAGEGHDLVLRICSACHDPRIIAQQRLSPEGWHDIVDQMASRGAQASDAELDEITAYLARSFPAQGGAAAGGGDR